MDHLDELESKSIYIIREAYALYRKVGLLWSIGKDSTTLLWLVRKAFFGKIPFPVIHIDTTYKFKEIYEFRDSYAKKFRRDENGIRAKERVFSPRDEDFEWDYKNQPPELWDQFKTKASEEEHLRVHPLLGWREVDVWEYVKRENIPMVSLYFANKGKRFRSIGCECCCGPVDSEADNIDKVVEELKTSKISERSGRAQDKESAYMMQKLRSLGYM